MYAVIVNIHIRASPQHSQTSCLVLIHAWYKSVRLWSEEWCIDWPNKGSSAQQDRQLIDREARGASFSEEGLFVLPIWQRGSRQPLIHAHRWQLKNSAIIMTNEERHHSQKIINNRRLRRNAKVREKRLLKFCVWTLPGDILVKKGGAASKAR